MKADKVTVTLKVEVLHIDSVSSLLVEAANIIRHEYPNGKFTASDGDTVEWKTESTPVEF